MVKSRNIELDRSKRTRGTIQKSIGPYFSDYIDRLVDTGRYVTVSEVLREALRLHQVSIKSPPPEQGEDS